MLNSPLIAHHPPQHHYAYPRYSMTSSSSRSPLYDSWNCTHPHLPRSILLTNSPADGVSGSNDTSSPPPFPGPPLLDDAQASAFETFFTSMPSSMIPTSTPHLFDPDLPDTTLWPSSIPRYEQPYAYNTTPVDLNPFNTGHLLERPAPTPNNPNPTTPALLNFGTDTNFAPTGYNPPPPPPTQHPDHDSEIRSKVLSALTKNESAYTTAANSPARTTYSTESSPSHSPGFHPHKRRATGDQRGSSGDKKLRAGSAGAQGKRDNLSEAQKRENHIHSEQKRRNLIRQGFDELCALVPELKAGGYSKSAVLLHAASYLDELKKGNEKLRRYALDLERERGY